MLTLAVLLGLLLVDIWLFGRLFAWLSRTSVIAPNRRFAIAIVAALGIVTLSLLVRCDGWSLFATAVAAAIGASRYQGEGFARLGEAMGRARLPILLLAVAGTAGLAYVHLPITTFMSSPGEIGLHLDYLLSVNARDAMMLVYAALLVYLLMPSERMRTVATLAALGVFVIALVYAYVLPFGYPKMTGLTFERIALPIGQHLLRALFDLGLIVALVFAIRAAVLRWRGTGIALALGLVQASLIAVSAISVSRDQVGTAGGPVAGVSSDEALLRFSRTHANVLVLYLDRFMGGYIEPILQAEPALAERLSGFTWYPRSVSAGENSIAGVHPMIGGYDYLPLEMNARNRRLVDLSIEAYQILPINFSRKGYRVNVINPGGLGFTMAGDCRHLAMERVHCAHIPRAVIKRRAEQMGFPVMDLSRAAYADLLALLASMRAAPYLLKDAIYARGPWRRYLDHTAGATFRMWAELDAFDELSSTDAREPNFNIVTNLLPHEPYFMGEDCVPRTQEPFTEAEAQARGHLGVFSLQHALTAHCALRMTADYLDVLKTRGVYENTQIVIVSDHGIVGPVRDESSRAVAGGTQDAQFVRTRSVLLVKPIGARGALRISEEFLPNAEVPRIVCATIGGCVNPFLGNRSIAAHGRDDPFTVAIVPWRFSRQKDRAFVIDERWTLIGKDPYNARAWREE